MTQAITGDTARAYFKKTDIRYAEITREDLDLLVRLVKEELQTYLQVGGKDAQNMAMEVRKPLVNDVKFTKNGLKYAFIKVDGSYFEKREAVSFNPDGHIGIAVQFDGVHQVPYLNAFMRWCDVISESVANGTRQGETQ